LFLTQQLQIKSRLQHIFMQLHVANNAVSNGRSGGAQAPERRSSPLAGGVG